MSLGTEDLTFPLTLSDFRKLTFSAKHTEPYAVPKEILLSNSKQCIIANYGELSADTIEAMIAYMNIRDDDVYYELGCGKGKCCFQMFFCTAVGKVVGIEIETRRVNMAINSLDDFRKNKRNKQLQQHFRKGREISFLRENILQVDFSDATIVYTCSWNKEWQEGPLNDYTVNVMNSSKKLRYVLALHHMRDLKNMHVVKVVDVKSDVYWGELAQFIYLHEKCDRHPILESIDAYKATEEELTDFCVLSMQGNGEPDLDRQFRIMRKDLDEYSNLTKRFENVRLCLSEEEMQTITQELDRRKSRIVLQYGRLKQYYDAQVNGIPKAHIDQMLHIMRMAAETNILELGISQSVVSPVHTPTHSANGKRTSSSSGKRRRRRRKNVIASDDDEEMESRRFAENDEVVATNLEGMDSSSAEDTRIGVVLKPTESNELMEDTTAEHDEGSDEYPSSPAASQQNSEASPVDMDDDDDHAIVAEEPMQLEESDVSVETTPSGMQEHSSLVAAPLAESPAIVTPTPPLHLPPHLRLSLEMERRRKEVQLQRSTAMETTQLASPEIDASSPATPEDDAHSTESEDLGAYRSPDSSSPTLRTQTPSPPQHSPPSPPRKHDDHRFAKPSLIPLKKRKNMTLSEPNTNSKRRKIDTSDASSHLVSSTIIELAPPLALGSSSTMDSKLSPLPKTMGDDFEKHYSTLSSQIAQLQEQSVHYQQLLQQERNNSTSLQKQLKAQQKKVSELEHLLEHEAEERHSLQTSLELFANVREQVKQYESSLEEIRSKREVLEASIVQMKQLEQETQNAQASPPDELLQRIQTLEKDLEERDQQLQTQSHEYRDLQLKLEDFHNNQQRLLQKERQENFKLTTKIKKLKEERNQWEKQNGQRVTELEQQLQAGAKEKETLKAKLSSMLQQHQNATAQHEKTIHDLHQDRQVLVNRVRILEEKHQKKDNTKELEKQLQTQKEQLRAEFGAQLAQEREECQKQMDRMVFERVAREKAKLEEELRVKNMTEQHILRTDLFNEYSHKCQTMQRELIAQFTQEKLEIELQYEDKLRAAKQDVQGMHDQSQQPQQSNIAPTPASGRPPQFGGNGHIVQTQRSSPHVATSAPLQFQQHEHHQPQPHQHVSHPQVSLPPMQQKGGMAMIHHSYPHDQQQIQHTPITPQHPPTHSQQQSHAFTPSMPGVLHPFMPAQHSSVHSTTHPQQHSPHQRSPHHHPQALISHPGTS